MKKKAHRSIDPGSLVTFRSPTKAFSDDGSGYLLDHRSSALILNVSEYDLTILAYGEVLYCKPDSDISYTQNL